MFPIMKKVVHYFICHFLYHVTYENIEQLNSYKKCILCPSHSNIFDPFFLFPKTDALFIMAKSEIFRFPFFGNILRHYQVFPIHRGKNDVQGIKTAIEIIQKHDTARLLLFPEGGILKDNDIRQKIKNGAVFLAATTQVPIIPISITRNPKLFSKVVVTVKEEMKVEKEVLQDRKKRKEYSQQLIHYLYEKENTK